MRRILASAVLLTAAAGALGAQVGPTGWELVGTLGAQFRGERGKVIDGAVIDAGIILPSATLTRWEFDAGLAQFTAHSAEDVSMVESSLEVDALLLHDFVRSGAWRLEGAVGPVVALGVGCHHDTDVPGDPASVTIACVNPAANIGSVQVGGRARLLGEWSGPRAGFYSAVVLSGHTVSSAGSLSPALVVGLRVPLR